MHLFITDSKYAIKNDLVLCLCVGRLIKVNFQYNEEEAYQIKFNLIKVLSNNLIDFQEINQGWAFSISLLLNNKSKTTII